MSREEVFEAALDCSLDHFPSFSKEDTISKFQSIFYNMISVAYKVKDDYVALSEEVTYLKKELITIKLVLVDKDIKLFELQSKRSLSNLSIDHNASTNSFADVLKGIPKQNNHLANLFRLQEWVKMHPPHIFPMTKLIHCLAFMIDDGPVVQNIKKENGRVILYFRDEASWNKAEELINSNKDQVIFNSVFVPPPKKKFPLIVRFHDLGDVDIFRGADCKEELTKQENALMKRILLKNTLVFRSQRPLVVNPNSFQSP